MTLSKDCLFDDQAFDTIASVTHQRGTRSRITYAGSRGGNHAGNCANFHHTSRLRRHGRRHAPGGPSLRPMTVGKPSTPGRPVQFP
jgi:hypothetical protein